MSSFKVFKSVSLCTERSLEIVATQVVQMDVAILVTPLNMSYCSFSTLLIFKKYNSKYMLKKVVSYHRPHIAVDEKKNYWCSLPLSVNIVQNNVGDIITGSINIH
jgi:hypothetical protein